MSRCGEGQDEVNLDVLVLENNRSPGFDEIIIEMIKAAGPLGCNGYIE